MARSIITIPTYVIWFCKCKRPHLDKVKCCPVCGQKREDGNDGKD